MNTETIQEQAKDEMDEVIENFTQKDSIENMKKIMKDMNKNRVKKRVGFTKKTLASRAKQYNIDKKRQKAARKLLRKSLKAKGRKLY